MVNSLFILFLKISLAHIKNKKFSRIPDYIPLVEYSGIHSLIKKFNTDYMLTKSHKERDSLLQLINRLVSVILRLIVIVRGVRPMIRTQDFRVHS